MDISHNPGSKIKRMAKKISANLISLKNTIQWQKKKIPSNALKSELRS